MNQSKIRFSYATLARIREKLRTRGWWQRNWASIACGCPTT